MILGSGPSKDIESFRNFDGIKIACDREYPVCVSEKIKADYVVTLEDGDLSHYFKIHDESHKPIVVMSNRVYHDTKVAIDKADMAVKLYTNEIINVCYSVGTMAWMYSWEKLGCKKIILNGFDSLQQYPGYDLLHHLWRDMFWELHDDYCPKDVETIFTDIEDCKVQRSKDSISLDRVDSIYPGFSDFKDYIRYRERRNDSFLRKLKVWQV